LSLAFRFNLARKIKLLVRGVNRILARNLWKAVDVCGKQMLLFGAILPMDKKRC